jgi:hypothetical protein
LLRAALVLLILAIPAAIYLLVAIPRLARNEARRQLQEAGLDSSFEISELTRHGLTLRNLHFGGTPGNLAVEELRAGFTFRGIRQGWIDEVRMRNMTGTAGLVGGRWTFGGLERLATLARSGKLAALSEKGVIRAAKVVVEEGVLQLSLPGMPTMSVPFEMEATVKEGSLYDFSARLSPDNHPLQLDGEFNPFTGAGRLNAGATAFELSAWTQYLLVDLNAPVAVKDISAKTDLKVSAIFESFALVWAHIDCELAGLDTTLTQGRVDKAPANQLRLPAGDLRATAHTASATIDILPPEDQGAPHVEMAASMNRATLAGGAAESAFTINLDALAGTGQLDWREDGRMVRTLQATLSDASLASAEHSAEFAAIDLEVPGFTNRDAMRWRATIASGRIRSAALELDYPQASARGTAADLAVRAEKVAFQTEDVRGTTELDLTLPGNDGSALSGTGRLLSLARGGKALVSTPQPFAFALTNLDHLSVEVPELHLPGLHGLAATEAVFEWKQTADGHQCALRGRATVPAEAWKEIAGSGTHPAEEVALSYAVSAERRNGETSMEIDLAVPKQRLSLSRPPLELSANVHADIAARTGVKDTLEARLQITDLSVAAEGRTLTCRSASVAGLRTGTLDGARLLAAGGKLPDLNTITATGRLQATGIAATLGLLKINGTDLDVPFRWHGPDGFRKTKHKPETATISLGQLRLGPVEVKASNTALHLEGRKLRLETELADAAASVTGGLACGISLDRESAALVRLDLDCQDLARVSWLKTVGAMNSTPQFQISGPAELSASLFVDPVSTAGTARLALNGVDFLALDGALSLAGVHAAVELREILPATTDPGQEVRIAKGRLGWFEFEDAVASFALPGNGELFVEEGSARWAGGELKTHSLRLSPAANAVSLDLYATNLSFAKLLAMQPLLRATGIGACQGHVNLRFSQNKVLFANSELYSTPGRGGRLRLADPARLLAILGAPPPHDEELLEAMRDLQYKSWQVALRADPSPQLVFRLDGIHRRKRREIPLGLARNRPLPSNSLADVWRILSATGPEPKPDTRE